MKMTLNAFKAPAAVIIVAFLSGFHGNASGDQSMICVHKAPARNVVQTCQTGAMHEQESEVLCESRASTSAVLHRYACTLSARDWSQPSPYAHTSRIWQCERENKKTLLFDQDFADDATRCSLLCGNCETGWQPKKPDH
jgi:hypothetical protein